MPISSERYIRAKELFLQACEQPGCQRDAFLGRACRGDEGLRREVLDLLVCLDQDDGREAPPAGVGATDADPVALQEAHSFWSEAKFHDAEPLDLTGIDSTRIRYADIARVGMHHPVSGMALALEALAFFHTPARNLEASLTARREAETIFRRMGRENYPPSPTRERNLLEDRGLVLNDLAGATCRLGALTDSLPLITESLRIYARGVSFRSGSGRCAREIGLVYRSRPVHCRIPD